jgi:hypothetical protein
MAKSKAAIRREFFERGSAAVQRVWNTEEEVYCCPICGGSFDRTAIDDGRLTLDHVPSKAQGGRAIVLTCYECNSPRAHKLDAAAAQRTTLWELTEALHGRPGNFQNRVTLEVGGHAVTADVDTSTGEIKLIPLSEWSDPGSFEPAMRYWREHSKEKNLEFQLKPRARLHVLRTKIADLRTAFLGAFARYGYAYAFHPHLEVVRRQIRETETRIMPHWWLRPDESGEEWPLIVELDQPVQALAFYLRTAAVVLPWIGKVPNPYDALAEACGPGTRVQISGSPRPWPRGMEMILDFEERPATELRSEEPGSAASP